MKTFLVSILGLAVATSAAGQTSASTEDGRQSLCERALLVGGPLESYLEGLGLDDPDTVGKGMALFETLRGSHPELPESYLKLAVLISTGSTNEPAVDSAEVTLELLARCEEAPQATEPADAEAAQPAPPEPTPPAPESSQAPTAPSVSEPPPAASVRSGPPRELFYEAVDLAQRGAFEEAKAIFRSLIRSHPELPEPYVNLGVLLAAEGQNDEASEMAEGALFAHPVCRAAFELTLMPSLSAHSVGVLADSANDTPNRVVGPLPETSPDVKAVAETVAAWSRAWVEERFGDFLEFYSADFQPAAGSRAQWQAGLRTRRAEMQSVKLEELSVDLVAPEEAIARFLHTARTRNGGSVIVRRSLTFEKLDSGWRIVREGSPESP